MAARTLLAVALLGCARGQPGPTQRPASPAAVPSEPKGASWLINCYRAGDLAGWGLYRLGESTRRLELVRHGVSSACWDPGTGLLAYLHNGNLWLRAANGRERAARGRYGQDGHRMLQFIHGQSLLVAVDPLLGRPVTFDFRRLLETSDSAPSAGDYERRLPRDETLEQLAAERPGAELRIDDLCTSPNGRLLAASGSWAGRAAPTAGHWVAVLPTASGTGALPLPPGRAAHLLDSRPYWLDASRLLAFERADSIAGTRDVVVWDTRTGELRPLAVTQGGKPLAVNSWLFDTFPAEGRLAVSCSVSRQQGAPERVRVCDRAGTVLWTGGGSFGTIDARFSPDGRRLCTVLAANPAANASRTTSLNEVWVTVGEVPTGGEDDLVLSTFSAGARNGPLDTLRDDPLVPYRIWQ
jgi:hypothetical protein